MAPSGVVGADGVEREAEVIIWGTGFDASRFTSPMDVHGLEGRELNGVWGDRPEAYLGTTVPGFPNLFILYGPNTNHGSGSVPFALECQFNYVVDAARRLRERDLRWIDLKPEALERWRAEMDRHSAETVWTNGGCTSWYTNAAGDNTNNWPGPWLEYRRRTRRINPGDYRGRSEAPGESRGELLSDRCAHRNEMTSVPGGGPGVGELLSDRCAHRNEMTSVRGGGPGA